MAMVSALSRNLLDEIALFRSVGEAVLGLCEPATPRDIVARVDAHVREIKMRGDPVHDEAVVGFGVLLGEQYVQSFGWHWASIVRDGAAGDRSTCVLSPDRAFAINPIGWVADVIYTDKDINFLMNFNMVRAGLLPPAAPDEALGLH